MIKKIHYSSSRAAQGLCCNWQKTEKLPLCEVLGSLAAGGPKASWQPRTAPPLIDIAARAKLQLVVPPLPREWKIDSSCKIILIHLSRRQI
jgi:hypothetical protein